MSERSGAQTTDKPEKHIELEPVTLRFGELSALSDVGFSVSAFQRFSARRGEIAVIIGGSGAGKTTLLRMIIGLLRPSSGAVKIDGEDIARMPESELLRIRAKFGMVFQYSALLDSLTVLEHVALPLKKHEQLTRNARRERCVEMLESLNCRASKSVTLAIYQAACASVWPWRAR